MSKHYNRILELKLRLLEEPGEKTFVVRPMYVYRNPSPSFYDILTTTQAVRNEKLTRYNTLLFFYYQRVIRSHKCPK